MALNFGLLGHYLTNYRILLLSQNGKIMEFFLLYFLTIKPKCMCMPWVTRWETRISNINRSLVISPIVKCIGRDLSASHMSIPLGEFGSLKWEINLLRWRPSISRLRRLTEYTSLLLLFVSIRLQINLSSLKNLYPLRRFSSLGCNPISWASSFEINNFC